MRLPYIMVLAIGLMSFSTPNRNITLKLTNATLVKIFAKIERQTDYHFIYVREHLQKAHRVSIYVREADINEVLDICLKHQNLDWEIKGNIIKVREKPIRLATLRIAGIIEDANQQPIGNAEVILPGSGRAEVRLD